MVNKKITIIGLGLIGGSLARALHERLGMVDITAVNRSPQAIELAVKDGSIRRGFSEINEYVYASDLIFICTPVKRAIEAINALEGKVGPHCIITDVASTKGKIVSHIDSMVNPPCFIGGHPMAGTEKAGYASGFAHLFENAYYVLTPCRNTPQTAVDDLLEIVKGIGAIPLVMDAGEHDRVTGGVSHVPHVIASALVNMVRELDTHDGNMQMLAAGGFRDITRIASSNPEIWENIVLSNKQQVKEILGFFADILAGFKDSLDRDDSQAILDFFGSAKEFRDSLSPIANGSISRTYEIIVDVVDKPGIIGEIATILGRNNINIKNINVTNNREFEQGCLEIRLSDMKSVNIAFDLLIDTGYKVYRNK